ncbi:MULTISPECIES: flagellar hook-associated protein FlgL [Cellulomonas]|uniref:Flagellar hook-associated protein 3 n=1 Tax=Cellulomonas gilvus (strain ATCC 13127 / NRRL B-14078) TaxID=593907 RepID=F8A5F1_CELGA|nr:MULTISPECIES: flagellar hook-associated protein FlgL [Cellulomonas]AEI10968.1 flagellar hook-associated protein 3 [Cellulomonas gilvus ATCC 13127]MCR6688183.1 flagellar hook-associated protein FlgL [Cellulomonas sp.]
MISRVTHQTVQRSTLANLQGNLTAMADLQNKMSSGKKVNVPSDDPSATSDVLRLRGEQRADTQYQRNAADAGSWLQTVDTAISSSLAALRQARDLTVRGGNGALGQTSLDALADEVDTLRTQLLSQANTTYVGRSVFAGTSDAPAAFDSAYAWSGTGSSVERRVSSTTTVRVDGDGAAVYGTGAGSVFALLDTISASLRAGTDPTPHLDAIDDRLESMVTQLAGVGARHKSIMETQETLAARDVETKARISGIEDVDLAEVILELQSQEVAYKGALGAAAKVLQPTLLDFLR